MAPAAIGVAAIRRHTLGGSLLVALSAVVFPLTAIVTAGFLSRRLGAAGYGYLSLAMCLAGWFMRTSGALFDKSLVRAIRGTDHWQPVATRAMQRQLLVSMATLALVWLLAGPIAAALDAPKLSVYLRLVALGIPLHNLTFVHRHVLVGLGCYRQRALAGTLQPLARLVLVLVLVQLGMSVEGALLGIMGAWLAELAFLRSGPAGVPLWRRSPYRVRQMAAYLAPLFLSALCVQVYGQVDLVLLKALGGEVAAVGFYAAAQNLSSVPLMLVAATAPLVLSSLTQLEREHGRAAAQDLARDTLRLAVLLLPLLALAVGAAPGIVGLIYGRAFGAAGPQLRLLLLSTGALLLVQLSTAILTAAGRPRWCLYLSGVMLAGALAGHALAIPVWGPMGAATVTAAISCLAAAAAMALTSLSWSVFPPPASLLRCAVVALAGYALPVVWPVQGPWVIAQLVGLGLLVCLALVLAGELRAKDLAALHRLLLR